MCLVLRMLRASSVGELHGPDRAPPPAKEPLATGLTDANVALNVGIARGVVQNPAGPAKHTVTLVHRTTNSDDRSRAQLLQVGHPCHQPIRFAP